MLVISLEELILRTILYLEDLGDSEIYSFVLLNRIRELSGNCVKLDSFKDTLEKLIESNCLEVTILTDGTLPTYSLSQQGARALMATVDLQRKLDGYNNHKSLIEKRCYG